MDFKTLYDVIFNGADLEFKYKNKFKIAKKYSPYFLVRAICVNCNMLNIYL